MPKNCLSLLNAYPEIKDHKSLIVLSCQDLHSWYKTGDLTDLDAFKDSEIEIEEQEGDKFKVIFNYRNPEFKKTLENYSKNINKKFEKFFEFLEEAKIEQILPVRVYHCPQSHGVVISSKNGKG